MKQYRHNKGNREFHSKMMTDVMAATESEAQRDLSGEPLCKICDEPLSCHLLGFKHHCRVLVRFSCCRCPGKKEWTSQTGRYSIDEERCLGKKCRDCHRWGTVVWWKKLPKLSDAEIEERKRRRAARNNNSRGASDDSDMLLALRKTKLPEGYFSLVVEKDGTIRKLPTPRLFRPEESDSSSTADDSDVAGFQNDAEHNEAELQIPHARCVPCPSSTDSPTNPLQPNQTTGTAPPQSTATGPGRVETKEEIQTRQVEALQVSNERYVEMDSHGPKEDCEGCVRYGDCRGFDADPFFVSLTLEMLSQGAAYSWGDDMTADIPGVGQVYWITHRVSGEIKW